MSHRCPFSSGTHVTFGAVLCLTAVACHEIVSLEPTIGPDEAISVPGVVGDWVSTIVDEQDRQDDSVWVHVAPGPDSTTYVVTTMRLGPVEPAFGRPTQTLRIAAAGDRLLGELTPSRNDPLVDSVTWRYGAEVQSTYQLVMLKVLGDELQFWTFVADSIRAALSEERCPSPGRVLERDEDLLFSGESRELRASTDCLIGIPGVLSGPSTLRRPQDNNNALDHRRRGSQFRR